MKVKGGGAIFWPDFGGAISRGDVAEGPQIVSCGLGLAGSVDAETVSAGICGGEVLAGVVGVVRRR
jgi:hypothetical protein